ncbi:hypothetical protein MICCA_600007 [Microcystis aeruginosa PCC 9432]|uniref:Uncharacterized protein n=1 Tax=Microcystis aeruginosa PCC 9432 TaxID=1160280 RepID=A0A831EHP7_MICAE|nr:hypothetical protein MICCA_600007 [Microcystis aeruginosa PCC 9432]
MGIEVDSVDNPQKNPLTEIQLGGSNWFGFGNVRKPDLE